MSVERKFSTSAKARRCSEELPSANETTLGYIRKAVLRAVILDII
jgi:hypothetical protein